MVDFSRAKIVNLAVHVVGNKTKNEKLILTEEYSSIVDDVTDQYIKEYFFSSFDFKLSYQFIHETNIELNEVYSYSQEIFDSNSSFIEQSKNIAKHLYEVSTHPNIKLGELYISYIKDCVIEGNISDVIGIFKSETKDYYLNLDKQNNSFNIFSQKGINTKKLDKGCLICDFKQKVPQKVYIVDSSRNDALYWKNNFLKITEIEDSYTNTSKILTECKNYISALPDIEKTSKISFLNNSVQYFESHDNYNFTDFANYTFEDQDYYEAFKSYIEGNDLKSQFEAPFEISKQAVTTVKRKIKNFIKLDSDIEIKIPSKLITIEKIIEQGYDKEKKMKYYKIYYTNEK